MQYDVGDWRLQNQILLQALEYWNMIRSTVKVLGLWRDRGKPSTAICGKKLGFCPNHGVLGGGVSEEQNVALNGLKYEMNIKCFFAYSF